MEVNLYICGDDAFDSDLEFPLVCSYPSTITAGQASCQIELAHLWIISDQDFESTQLQGNR